MSACELTRESYDPTVTAAPAVVAKALTRGFDYRVAVDQFGFVVDAATSSPARWGSWCS